MEKKIYLSGFLLLLILAMTTNRFVLAQNKKSKIEIFKSYITGNFDNSRQIVEEQKKGKPIHPYSKHVNRVANAKIKNLPADLKGFYLLEESYYKTEGQDTLIKPFLFFFEVKTDGNIRLHSLDLPKDLDKKLIRNDNQNLFFDYLTLKESPFFKPADYTLTKEGFYLKAPNQFPNGMTFTLEETIGKDKLTVMELLEKDGKSMTPYNTPIIYDRIPYAKVFQSYLSGTFDNARQVEEERKAGKQIHPFAKHVNALADDKIKNKPKNLKGFFMIVESYYQYEGQEISIKPHLFYFEELEGAKIRLNPLQIPAETDLKEVRNENSNLSFDYKNLKPLATFTPADYSLTERGFYIKAVNLLPENKQFTLEETLGENKLEVLELLEKDGKRISLYDTPIIYERITK